MGEEKVVLRVRIREGDEVTISGAGDPEILLIPVQAFEEAPEGSGSEVAPGVYHGGVCGYLVAGCTLYAICLEIKSWRGGEEVELIIYKEGHLSEFNNEDDGVEQKIVCGGKEYDLPYVLYTLPNDETTVLEAITNMLIDEERALERALLKVIYAFAEIAKGEEE